MLMDIRLYGFSDDELLEGHYDLRIGEKVR